MNKRVFNFCALGIVLVAVVLWVVAMAVKEFNFNLLHMFGLIGAGCGILFEVTAVISRNTPARYRALLNIGGGIFLVAGAVLFGIAYKLAWFYVVGMAVVLAVLSIAIRVACGFGKWDQGNDQQAQGAQKPSDRDDTDEENK